MTKIHCSVCFQSALVFLTAATLKHELLFSPRHSSEFTRARSLAKQTQWMQSNTKYWRVIHFSLRWPCSAWKFGHVADNELEKSRFIFAEDELLPYVPLEPILLAIQLLTEIFEIVVKLCAKYQCYITLIVNLSNSMYSLISIRNCLVNYVRGMTQIFWKVCFA